MNNKWVLLNQLLSEVIQSTVDCSNNKCWLEVSSRVDWITSLPCSQYHKAATHHQWVDQKIPVTVESNDRGFPRFFRSLESCVGQNSKECIHFWSLTLGPWIQSLPTEKDRLPTIIFQGPAVKCPAMWWHMIQVPYVVHRKKTNTALYFKWLVVLRFMLVACLSRRNPLKITCGHLPYKVPVHDKPTKWNQTNQINQTKPTFDCIPLNDHHILIFPLRFSWEISAEPSICWQSGTSDSNVSGTTFQRSQGSSTDSILRIRSLLEIWSNIYI